MARKKTRTLPSGAPPQSETLSTARAAAELFLISAVILFLELACIRWFPANVLFLTFFTNTVLLACFLGMSLGCLAAGHGRKYLNSTPLLLALAVLAGCSVEVLRDQVEKIVDVGNQASPQLIFFGADYQTGAGVDRFFIPIEVVEGIFFLLIALVLVGPGQQLGRSLTRLPNRIQAYTVNILGSIAGIAVFSLCSWLQLSPMWWLLIVALGLSHFLFRPPLSGWHVLRCVLLVSAVLLPAVTTLLTGSQREERWSPYYRVDYFPADREIKVNLIGHQQMISRNTTYPAYAVPHLLNRDAGGQPFRNVLIIGAGSGNDVSRALQWGAEHIDAVEIDPVIEMLGRRYHPDQPYDAASRVTVHQADGRNFLRSTEQKYDLIIYALVDSLVLHSSYSNIRLESYLFTREAFADVKRCLKPDGLFVMYNYFRQGWLVARLQRALAATFEAEPLVFTLPYSQVVDPDKTAEGFTLFIAGRAPALERLRKAFDASDEQVQKVYWLNRIHLPDARSPDGFNQRPTAANLREWLQIGPVKVNQPAELAEATDDWPFLYLRRPMIPDLGLRGAAIMGGIAVLLLLWFVPPRQPHDRSSAFGELRAVRDHWTTWPGDQTGGALAGRMFFLGAGFMLIETTAVVRMALVFGSTWMVNSVVFLAVLVMILLANLFVLKAQPRLLWPYYLGLFATLALNVVVPLDFFLGWPAALQITASCLLVFAPVLFAAVIFAVSFSRTSQPDRAFGFNIAGAMVGGLAEYSSMLLGFRLLLLVAMAFYALSIGTNRSTQDVVGTLRVP